MLFYLILDNQGVTKLSPFPEQADPGPAPAHYLRPGLPLFYWQQLPPIPVGSTPARVLSLLRRRRELAGFDWAWHELPSLSKSAFLNLPSADSRAEFHQFVLGKQLTEQDLVRTAAELKVDAHIIMQLAESRVQSGLGEWVPAVTKRGRAWLCQRCGETNIQEWPGVYGVAGTCLSCQSLGASTTMNIIYRDLAAAQGNWAEVGFAPDYQLTAAQELASAQVLTFLHQERQPVGLLWAACGAGKTEVCFPAIAWALERGQSVLFAAPRQDVIHDVAPRLKANFPSLSIQVLTGDTRFVQTGKLVLATTHQVLRFHQFFDLVILDEMDAFPYHGSRALKRALSQAKRPEGKMLCLTATPGKQELAAARREHSLIRLPARHHRRPLPVPVFRQFKFSAPRRPELPFPQDLAELLGSLADSGPVLIFVPLVAWVEPWVDSLRRVFPDWRLEGSHSKDPQRRLKIEELTAGKYQAFVSTSILERGVTIAGVQVLVLGAEHPLFDERALVQMAGRAGRTGKQPAGSVFFLGARLTTAVKTAINWITEQNEAAAELGLLDDYDGRGGGPG